MNILELAILKKMVGGGGGSGTDNYNDLSNLPQINGETLAGNKTAENLGLQDALTFDSAPTEDSTNPVESGGVYNALAGKQDNLTFDDDPTENSTNPVKSGGVYSALAGKQDNLTFDGVYNASTNKAATESTVTNAIAGLDVSDFSVDADETISSISETDGKINVTKQDIAIASNQVTAMTGYTKPSSAPATPAIQTSDTANQAFGKLEFKADTNQTNILYALNKVGKNNFNYTYVGDGNNYGKTFTSAHATFEVQSDNTALKITTDGAVTTGNPYIFFMDENGDYINFKKWFDGRHYLTGIPSGASVSTHRIFYKADSQASVSLSSDTLLPDLSTATNVYIGIQVQTGQNYGSTGVLYQPMIILDTLYASDPSYESASLPNSDLTYLEAEDRAALAEVVDSGAKNLFDFANATFTTQSTTTYTKAASSITIETTGVYGRVVTPLTLKKGTYTLSTKISNFSSANAVINISSDAIGTDSIYGYVAVTGNGDYKLDFTLSSNATVYIALVPRNTGSTTSTTEKFTASDIMVSTKAAFGVSPKFVPYKQDPFYQIPINHNMIYRGKNLGDTLTDAQHTALSSGNFTDLYLGDYWSKTVTIPAGTYTGGDSTEVTVPAQTNITLKAVIADFDTFYAGYASTYAGINTHHAAIIVTGFSNVVWNGTNSTAGGYVNSLIHKWLVGSVLPQMETWFGSAKVLSHQKLLTNAITGDAASGWAWSSQKISLLSENQMYGSKVWGNSKATNGAYEPGEAFKHLNVFNHIDANLLFGNKNMWLRDIASAVWAAYLSFNGDASYYGASTTWIAPAALILLS